MKMSNRRGDIEILQLNMKQGLEEVLILILDFLIQLAQRNKNLTRRTIGVVRNTTFFPQIGILSDAIP